MKRIAILTILIVFVALAGLLLLRFLTSVDNLKSGISQTVSELTGRELTFDGQARLTFTPGISIAVSDLVISGPGVDGEVMRAERMTAAVRFWPLLLGRAEFDTFYLLAPRFTLSRDASGLANWIFPTGRSAADPHDHNDDVRFGRLDVEDGSISYDDKTTGVHMDLSRVAMQIDWASSTAKLRALGSFEWNGEVVELDTSIASPHDLIHGGQSQVRIDAAAAPLEASFAGSAAFHDAYQMEGDVRLTTPSLRRAIHWLHTPMGEGSLLGAASLSGHANWVDKTLSFSQATAELDGNSAEGAFSIGWQEIPYVHGTLAFDTLDLTAYLEEARTFLTAPAPNPGASPAVPLPAMIEADMRLSADSVVIGGLVTDQAAATATLAHSLATVTVGEMAVSGGNVAGMIELSSLNGVLAGRAQGAFRDVNVASFLADMGAPPILEGTVSGEFEGRTDGHGWDELSSRIAGFAHASIADGGLNGFDPALIPVVDKTLRLADMGGSMAFRTMSGILAIEGTDLGARDVAVLTQNLEIRGGGNLSLLTGEIAAQVQIIPAANQTPSDETPGGIELSATGLWANPLISVGRAAVAVPDQTPSAVAPSPQQ